jgi:hypothetical protein
MAVSQNIWTYKLTAGTLNIDPNYGLLVISILLESGTGTVTGTALLNGVASTPIDLTIGLPLNISTDGNTILGDVNITTTGVVTIVGRS